jgi:endonuclease YncB( thermonuclease family)
MLRVALGFTLALLFHTSLFAASFEITNAKVHRLIDGDTLVVDTAERGLLTLRLWGIDCPEKKQRFGSQATEFLAFLVSGKPLTVKVRSQDQYGRNIAQVFYSGADIGLMMVRHGYAWHYIAVTKDKNLAQAQVEAQKQHLGLWQDKNPTAPWVFRKVVKWQ